jgi:hypothetical protein
MTWGKRLYFPSEGRHAEDFFARKIRQIRADLNPQSWVPEASMLTTKPPKLLFSTVVEIQHFIMLAYQPNSRLTKFSIFMAI